MNNSLKYNSYRDKTAQLLSLSSGGLSFAACILVLSNKILYTSGEESVTNIILIILTVIMGFKAKSGGLATVLFLLPLLPGFKTQLVAFTGLSFLNNSINGLDIVSGFVIGVVINSIFQSKSEFRKLFPQWQFGLLTLILLFSTSLGISRNLWQSASLQSLDGLIYNLLRFNQHSWHDDYRPLTDFISYLVAIAWVSVLIPVLQSSENRFQKVFRPIIIGLIISALFGLLQVLTGLGTPGDRSDRVIGIAAKGFAPDIHAYAGHMLLGVIGLIGYFLFLSKKRIENNIIVFTMVISWLALIFSKSRNSLLIAILVVLPLCGMWVWRKNKKIFLILTASIVVIGGVAIYFRYFYNHPSWVIEYLINLAQYEVFNRAFGYRIDMYIAAVRMFSAFPFFGLGLGNFYRMSADIGFSHSSIYSFLKGENAHNYFLQTLVETGVLGSLVFIYILIKPLLSSNNRKQKIIAYIGFAGLCAGNIFAHSFLIREYLFLSLTFIALSYACEENLKESYKKIEIKKTITESIFDRKLIFTIILVTLILTTKEIIDSFNKYPYNYGSICFESREKTDDHWLSGRYITSIPLGSKFIAINFAAQGSNRNVNPIDITVSVIITGEGLVISKKHFLSHNESSTLHLEIPERIVKNNKSTYMEIKANRCFTPKNLGVSADNRRLGVKLNNLGIIFK